MKNSSFATIFNRLAFTARSIWNDPNLTVEDLNNRWQDSYLCDGSSINFKKLNRDRASILELMGIDIRPRRCDDGSYCYYVKNKAEVQGDYILKWTFNTLSMVELVKGHYKLRDRILLEDYAPDPHLLPIVLQAMDKNYQLRIEYKRFTNMDTKIHIVEPFCIRDYQHRLYVVARIANHGKPCVFSFDRIVSIEVIRHKFKMPANFSPELFFADYYGVMVPDNMEPESIVIRAYHDEMFYLHTKPLHHSQKPLTEVQLEQGFCDFSLFLAPTLDFIGYLLSRADRLEVLSPAWLRQSLLHRHQSSASLYVSTDTLKE